MRKFNSRDPGGLAIRLSWIVVLLDPIGHPVAQVPLAIAAVLGLVNRRLEWNAALWWIATLMTLLPIVDDWHSVDNHAFLRFYWSLAIAISANAKDPRATLAGNARGLVAFAFLFALLWKAVLSPDFWNGSYLRFSFLSDPRFADWSAITTGLAVEDQASNRELVREWLAGGSTWRRDFVESPGLATLARATSLWTLGVEAAVALLFFWPRSSRVARWRDAALLVFAVTTYAFATVEGFGWLLCILGLAQCEPDRPKVVLAYLAVFLLILVYAWVPWSGWLAAALA